VSLPFEALAAAVQGNCDISDAAFARDMTLCNYLLAMREYFCWAQGLPPGREPDRAAVGAWIAARERRWDALDDAEYAPLPLPSGPADPFAVEAINAVLATEGWVYGAAVGRFGKPHFFLGRLARSERREGIDVVEVGREVARDIEAAPASLAAGRIVLRGEAFERWLWSSARSWDRSHESGPMRAALAAYGYEADPARAIAAMAAAQRETLLLHELGEHAAGRMLGEPWEAYLRSRTDRRAALSARAVRDLLADCLVTLPAIADRKCEASLHFWFATFDGLRREFFPELTQAYGEICRRGDWQALVTACRDGCERWAQVARALVQDAAAPQ
jgi:hypothetical protein